MFERKATQQLLAWKNRRNRQTVLLLEGAQRVGKRTLAQEFGRRHYKSTLTIDFASISDDLKSLFLELRIDIQRLYQYFSAIYNVPLHPKESLLLFCNVQHFPLARAFVKHIAADASFDCIETGSLLSIKQNIDGILIPSEEESLRLHPLDFEEFLCALDEQAFVDILKDTYVRCGLCLMPCTKRQCASYVNTCSWEASACRRHLFPATLLCPGRF